MRERECAEVARWQNMRSGIRVCSIGGMDELNLFTKRDFQRFKAWLNKAEAWVTDSDGKRADAKADENRW